MTKSEAHILECIAALPEADRRRLVKHLIDTNSDQKSIFETLTDEQRAHLREGIEQAERGETVDAEDVFVRLKQRIRSSGA
ncbi:MAG: hypothetical protein C0511_12975 [Hyphomicrobium sp.]|nr:hypothetical protein [Hyphomicrobium sp.]